MINSLYSLYSFIHWLFLPDIFYFLQLQILYVLSISNYKPKPAWIWCLAVPVWFIGGYILLELNYPDIGFTISICIWLLWVVFPLGGFVLIDGQRGVYYSESWECNGSTLYLPVNGTVLANIEKYDQISFEQGCFCIGNAAGGFQQKVQGRSH